MNKRITTLLLGLCMSVSVSAAEIEASVNWAQRVVLSTPVSGVVAELTAQPGMQVRKGDVLLKLDQTTFNAHVKQAQADVNKTRYALEEEQRQWERAEELYERTVTSTRELKVSEIEYQTAKSNHSSAVAKLSLANKAKANSLIKAPFDGVVIATHVSKAETVVTRLQQVPMITLGMTGRYHAVASVDAATAASLENGMAVQVKTDNGTSAGKLVFVAVEPDNGNYTVKAEFDSTDVLRIGTQASIITP